MSPLARPGPRRPRRRRRPRHAQVGPQRPRRGRRPGRRRRPGADGRLDGRRGAGGDARHGRRPLPLPVARPAVAQGRVVGQRPPAALARPRLRRRRAAHRRGAARPDLPPRDPLLLRPRRAVAVPSRASSPATPSPAPGSDPMELPEANDAWQGFAWLEDLWATIAERAAQRPHGSYTVELLDGGVDVAGPQGRRGGDRGPARGEERRGRRGRGRRPDGAPRPVRRRGRRTSSTTRSCCWPSAASSRAPSSTTLRARHGRPVRA